MALNLYKPVTPGRRSASVLDYSALTRKDPEWRLIRPLKQRAGRNNYGRITCRHRGGGNKRKYRVIDFKRDKDNIPAKVSALEYDPNRNVFIVLLVYADGEKRYILAPEGLTVGQVVMSGERTEFHLGNALPLSSIPTGMLIHNVELQPGRGGQLVRGAGTSAQVMGLEGPYALVRLPSGEVRKILGRCRATLGRLGNIDYNKLWLGKAGRRRWLGWRPSVRGTAQNPVAHPMGGGEGRTGGGRHPCSKWGKPAKGGKTRNPRRGSTQFIIRRRPRGRFQKT